jgi:hypothetical protein
MAREARGAHTTIETMGTGGIGRLGQGSLVFLAALAAVAIAATWASAAAPSVTIDSPTDLETISSGTVPVDLTVSDFILDCVNIGKLNAVGSGHYHVLLDGVYQKYDCRAATWLANVPVGTHSITIQLANNNHSLVGANASVNFTVASATPRLAVVLPTSTNAIVALNSSSVRFELFVENFTLDATHMGGTNEANHGHIHVILNDVTTLQMAASTTFNFSGLAAGTTYKFTFELHENDDSLLVPATFDAVWVTVLPGRPSIKIIDPLPGSTVALNWTFVTVEVSNFTLDPAAIGSAPVAGRGHYHVFVDGVYRSMAGTTTAAVIDLGPGPHSIRVELYNNNHVPLAAPVFDDVRVMVTGAKPSIAITSQLPDSIVWGNSTNLTVSVVNFILDPDAIGGAVVNGRGHMHLYVDDAYLTATTALTISVVDLAPGDHWINVTLNNNDHSALGVPQMASLLVHVAKVPVVTILSPASGFRTSIDNVTITVSVIDLIIDPEAYGKSAVAGHGHFHLFVDSTYAGPALNTTFKVGNLPVGVHTISVRAFNNDHTEIPGSHAASVQVEVTAAAPPGGFLPAAGLPELMGGLALAAAAASFVTGRRRARLP